MSSISALNSLLGSNYANAIDLSSILQAAMGSSSSGIDVTAAVNSAVTAAQAPELAWESEGVLLQNQSSALTTLQAGVSTLDADMQTLNDLGGPLAARTVASSNANVVTGSASAGAATGNHVIVVNNLATTASWSSGTFTSSSTPLPAGNFTITLAGGTTQTITTDGTQTLSDVANQINGDGLGVTASVVTDSSGSRLAIVSNASGSANNFSISTGSGSFGFSQAASGTDASLTVDGINVTSGSNTVTGAVPGLTLNLLSAQPGTEISLKVAPDSTAATNAINQFVSDYNNVITQLTSQFTFNGTSEGVLATDSTVRSLQSSVLSAITYTYSPASGTTTVPNLTSLGISVGNDGQLSVDSSKLQNVLANNFSDVQNFFQGSALNGFANSVDQQLSTYLNPGDGAFTLDLQSLSNQTSDLQKDISNFETNRIAPLRTQLQSAYSQAEIALQQLPMEMKQLNAELGGNSSSN